MGLFGAMTASVSGLGAQGQAISVISDNLANTNTIGYKASRTLFNQLVTSAGVSGTAYNSGGVGTNVGTDQASQGSFITSTSKTDIAISGNGFFRVADSKTNSTSTSFFYTRAGSFSEDKEGFLVNPAGYYLQGWKTDSDGTILNVQDPQAISLQSVGVSAQATTEFSIDANLNNTETINTIYSATSLQDALNAVVADPTRADYVSDIRVYDAQGGARDMTIAFTKRSANVWDWQILTDGVNIQGGTAGVGTRVGQGVLEFNTNGGSLKYASTTTMPSGEPTGTTNVNIQWANGIDASSIKMNFGDFTGGKTVDNLTGGLAHAVTNVPGVTATTIANLVGATAPGSVPDGIYTIRRVDADTIELFDVDGTTSLGTQDFPAPSLPSGAGATITFANGTRITTSSAFDIAGFANGAALGTLTVGDKTSGGVYAISSENNLLPAGTYQLINSGPNQFTLTTPLGTDTVTIADTGTREMYFANSGVRITVGESFDANPGEGVYTPAVVVGTFDVDTTGALDKGVGTDGVTQLSSAYNTSAVNQNGFGAGTLAGISIDGDGFVNGTFTNGETKKLYKIALAVFQNPRGLEMISGSLLRTTEASGQALLKEPGLGGTGSLVGGSLEGSTTDIAGEFSNMIVAQRAFQASSKVITTVDQMLNELLQLR